MDSRALPARSARKKSLIAAVWIAKHGEPGELADGVRCHDPTFPGDLAAHRKLLGCERPDDDYREEGGGENCADCRARQWCNVNGEVHGRMYIGRPGFGFRSNRCPRSWASNDFVREVHEAYIWSEKAGGAFRSAHGADPAAVLMDAVLFYSNEVESRRAYEWERRRQRDEQ